MSDQRPYEAPWSEVKPFVVLHRVEASRWTATLWDFSEPLLNLLGSQILARGSGTSPSEAVEMCHWEYVDAHEALMGYEKQPRPGEPTMDLTEGRLRPDLPVPKPSRPVPGVPDERGLPGTPPKWLESLWSFLDGMPTRVHVLGACFVLGMVFGVIGDWLW